MKVFLLIILILIIAGAGMFYIKSQLYKPEQNLKAPLIPTATPSPLPSPSPSPTFDPSSPSGVVQNFYNAYEECITNPQEEASENVSQYCQANNPYASTGLTANIKLKGKLLVDPITCSQNTVDKIEVQVSTPSATVSRIDVEVIEYFGNGPNNILVQVSKQKGEWKVNNITCPEP